MNANGTEPPLTKWSPTLGKFILILVRAISMTSCFVYRNFRERRRVSVDVQDGGTHKPGSHAVGVDTGGGLTDSGEKTSSSKSVSLF